MSQHDWMIGRQRRRLEDGIVEKFQKVNFDQQQHAWLEDDDFWDFIFEWYALAKYYEDVPDTAIGAHMLDLYADCVAIFRIAQADDRIRERRRDRATDALYQINYYMNMLLLNVRRNVSAQDDTAGSITWK